VIGRYVVFLTVRVTAAAALLLMSDARHPTTPSSSFNILNDGAISPETAICARQSAAAAAKMSQAPLAFVRGR